MAALSTCFCNCSGVGNQELLETDDYVIVCTISLGLVIFSAVMSGLTMALMSLDTLNLKVLSASGNETEKSRARILLPFMKHRHFLLATLLLCNTSAMEALPIFLDKILPSYVSIILSVSFLLIFGDILPQAIFTKHRIRIGAAFAPLVWILLIICFPVSYPIAALLDYFLGQDHPTIYRKAELKELTKQHLVDSEFGRGSLSQEEVVPNLTAPVLSKMSI